MGSRSAVVLVDPILSGRGLIDAARRRGHAVIAVINLPESLLAHVELPGEEECELVLYEREAGRIASVPIRAFAGAPGRVLLVAEVDDAAGDSPRSSIIGFAELDNGIRRRMAHKVSGFMSVLPEWRAVGVGGALGAAIHSWAHAEPSVEKVSFTVLSTNEASLALTRGFGMQEEAVLRREVRLGPGEYADMIIMSYLLPTRAAEPT